MSDGVRRYLTIIQDPGGYPASNAPADRSMRPVVHSVVLADDFDRLQQERDLLANDVAVFAAERDKWRARAQSEFNSHNETLSAAEAQRDEAMSNARRATALAEQYGEAIVRISVALGKQTVTSAAAVRRAQAIIAGLGPGWASTVPTPEDDRLLTDEMVERAARAMNLEAGRQRGLAFEDDWPHLTEQERGGWRLVARAGLKAANLNSGPS